MWVTADTGSRLEIEHILAALDAALAEPDAKKKPATMKQISAAHGTTIGAPWFEDFARAWKAAERHHGIRKKDK
jgi:hypothetical protein